MLRTRTIAIPLLLGITLSPALWAAEPIGVFRMDPVELVRGREVAGAESIYADHYVYRYLFSSDENKATFLRDPAKYEIQYGGGCGRMGPLSGLGSVDRFAVHDGRIYIFASDQCRDGFRKAPDALLEQTDPPPQADEAATRRGREMLDRIIAAMGGAKRIDALRSYRERRSQVVESRGEKVQSVETTTFVYPDRVATESAWGASVWRTVAVGDDGWFTGPREARPMHRQQLDALRRAGLGHDLIHLLQSRSMPGFTCAARGPASLTILGKAVDVEQVAVGLHGATTLISVDPKSARVIALEYRGRGPRLTFGKLERIFTEHRDFDGVTLPANAETRFDGEAVPHDGGVTVELQIDPPLDDALFRAPPRD